MTSFCRRVIAMRMIVANKKRIARFFSGFPLFVLTGLVPGFGIPMETAPRRRDRDVAGDQ